MKCLNPLNSGQCFQHDGKPCNKTDLKSQSPQFGSMFSTYIQW
ncbi:hypothetical protein D1AOALGA4SA_11171 [Olavius algarvensis Delta 1 endosymbiont]|nr:hypothetical protein D1AOALGA4SA_11171 [Olavius algarvensis Delta 1 endosymbiont]